MCDTLALVWRARLLDRLDAWAALRKRYHDGNMPLPCLRRGYAAMAASFEARTAQQQRSEIAVEISKGRPEELVQRKLQIGEDGGVVSLERPYILRACLLEYSMLGQSCASVIVMAPFLFQSSVANICSWQRALLLSSQNGVQ